MKRNIYLSALLLFSLVTFSGCGKSETPPFQISDVQGSRDATPCCLVTQAPGTSTFQDASYLIDYSNANEGYIMVAYTGTCPKAKLQITLPNGTTYSYDLHDTAEAFPLSSDSGTYTVAIYENVELNAYSTLVMETLDVTIENTFGAYLYPNQYVTFTEDMQAIELGRKLAFSANNDLDVVSNVYNYLITHLSYDEEKAQNVQSDYLPNIDETLATQKGICLDYAALMASILRSQSIPTHMEVGYAGAAYHAWISTYIKDIGWVNGIIEFDGTNWEMMDPTFGSTTDAEELKQYIGDGTSYVTKFIY